MLKRVVLLHLFAHVALLRKQNAKRKLAFQMKNGFRESAIVFHSGTERCRVVLGAAEQRTMFTLKHEEQMKFVQVDIESAQRKFDETRATLEKAVQEYFRGVEGFAMNFRGLANNADEMELDQDLFNANDEVAQRLADLNNDERLDMLACIARALQGNVRIASQQQAKWEEFQTKKRVLHETQVQNEKVRKEIKEAMERDASMNMDAWNLDGAKVVQRLEQLTQAMQMLMLKKSQAAKNSKSRPKRSTSIHEDRGRGGGDTARKQKSNSKAPAQRDASKGQKPGKGPNMHVDKRKRATNDKSRGDKKRAKSAGRR